MRALVAALLLAGCDSGGLAAPHVPEPSTGATLDRCLARVRTSQPGYTGDPPRSTGTESGVHIDYRVNGGPQIPVDNFAFVADEEADYHEFAPVIFGATLVDGANHLEVGNCDAVDVCQWTPTDVSVSLAPGSPDPAFGAGGQAVQAGFDGFHVLPLADGKSLVAVDFTTMGVAQVGILGLTKDGALDTLFGTRGVTTLASHDGQPYVAAIPGGGFVVVVRGMLEVYGSAWVARLDAHGNLDTSFGTQGLEPLALPGVGAFLDVQGFAADAAGHLYGAGIASDTAHAGAAAPVAFELDTDGSVLASQLFGDGAAGLTILASAIDAHGTAAIVAADRVYRGSVATGADLAFGTAGSVALPDRLTFASVAVTATGVAVATSGGLNTIEVLDIPPSGALAPIAIPWTTSAEPLIASAPDGALYVAATLPHPADDALSFTTDQTSGTDIALVRLRAGVLDPAFGFAHASLMLSWPPPAIDTLLDTPSELVIGSDGAPYIVASSISAAPMPSVDTRRGPGFGVVRFMH